MGENSEKKLPKFGSIDALVEFFDENDLGQFSNELPEAHFDVDLHERSRYVRIDNDVADRIDEISKEQHLPSTSIVNSWLREKLSDLPHSN